MPDAPRRTPTLLGPEAERRARALRQWRDAWGDHLAAFAWTHYVTLTFGLRCGVERAAQLFLTDWHRRVSRSAQRPVPWYLVIERGASGENTHIHALVAGTKYLATEQLEGAWKYGRAEVKVYVPTLGAAYYVTKEIADRCAFYDVSRRLPHRLRIVAPVA